MAWARFNLASVAIAFFSVTSVATAQLDDHLWIGGTGNQQWQLDANWSLTPFPNDPGRVDPDMTVITNVEGANLSVNLPANLTVNVGATDVTVAALTIGSTGSPVTTNITTSGGRLVFENNELNNTTDPDNVICAFNCGAALITSQGVPGSTNTISAVVGVNDSIDVTGTNSLTLAGGVAEIGTAASLRAVSPSTTVLLTGSIVTLNQLPEGGVFDAPLGLNNSNTSQGTLDVSGIISGNGRVQVGAAETNSLLPLGTVILRSANTYNSRTFVGRGNVVLANNSAFGATASVVRTEGPALQTGYNFRSDDDTRSIPNDMELAEWATAKGEHSLTWAGKIWQTNTRGWINMLPAGQTLTLSGGLFPNRTTENPPLPGRNMVLDGTGKTLVTGGLHNEYDDDTQTVNPGNFIGSFRFRGTGTVVISGGNSTYSGDTNVDGSNVHFATNTDFGNTAQIVSTGGAVGVDAGVIGNDTFLGKINAADHGGLMLGTAEYGANLDFTSGTLANAANMSLAAHETGSNYTGTITPAANTYRLGGGSGTLTLPNANQLTGARNVVATNGGEVSITASNNYTGTTSVVAKYQVSQQDAAARDTNNFDDDDDIPNDQMYVGTTLRVGTLANGGAASNIGSSASAASNLFIQGSTLKYVGGAASTDRLFTIGSSGATIDASGSGALNLTNTAALGVDIAEQRTGNVNAFATGNGAEDRTTVRNLASTLDLRPGMPIMSPGLPLTGDSAGILASTTITRIVSATEVTISNPVGSFAFYDGTPITFGPAPARELTLTGANTGNNTLASVIPNASDGGGVGLTKAGAGKWVVTGTNTYTGDTSVEAGTLSISNAYLANASDVRMTSGGIFDLNFAGTDVINSLFFNDLAQAVGTWGAIGNAAATFQSAFFTGTGLLQVLTVAATGLAGDYNNNGVVDAADYVVWRNGGPLQNEGAGISPGVVDDADYTYWRSQFGNTVGAGSGNAASLAGAVPEPGTMWMTVVAGCAFLLWRRPSA